MPSEWKSPAIILAIAGLVLSLIGNGIQFAKARSESRIAEQRFLHEEKRWAVEKQQLEAQIAAQLSLNANRITDRENLQIELTQVDSDIGVWESGLTRSQIELANFEGQLKIEESTGDNELANATRKNIELQKWKISMQEGELERAKTRRSEIETQLRQ